jgi:hypothetical protein
MSDRYGTFDGTVAGFKPWMFKKEKRFSFVMLEAFGPDAFETEEAFAEG